MRGAADTTLQKEVKETQLLVFQPLTSPFDFLTVENETIACSARLGKPPRRFFLNFSQKFPPVLQYFRAVSFLFPCFSYADYSRTVLICTSVQLPRDPCPGMHPPSARAVSRRAITKCVPAVFASHAPRSLLSASCVSPVPCASCMTADDALIPLP